MNIKAIKIMKLFNLILIGLLKKLSAIKVIQWICKLKIDCNHGQPRLLEKEDS